MDCKIFACVFGQPIEVDQDQNIGLSGQKVSHVLRTSGGFFEKTFSICTPAFCTYQIFFRGFTFARPAARPTHDDGRPPTMPLSSTVTAMKTKAAAILSRGLTAAFVFILPRVTLVGTE